MRSDSSARLVWYKCTILGLKTGAGGLQWISCVGLNMAYFISHTDNDEYLVDSHLKLESCTYPPATN